jgi:hypothetical protein
MRILPHHVDNIKDPPLGKRDCDGYTPKPKWVAFNRLYKKMRLWIKRRAGREADEVYSEWARLPWLPEMFRNQETFRRFVDKAVEINGELFGTNGFWRPLSHWGSNLYIYNGELCYRGYVRPAPVKKESKFIILSDYTQLVKEKGLWYFIVIPRERTIYLWDEDRKMRSKTVPVQPRTHYHNLHLPRFSPIFSEAQVSKKSLSSKELKSFGMKNDLSS